MRRRHTWAWRRREVVEERREEKQMDTDIFLHMGEKKKKKKKGDGFVVKLGILDFLLGCFTDGFIEG